MIRAVLLPSLFQSLLHGTGQMLLGAGLIVPWVWASVFDRLLRRTR
jgi:hypothetical protein